MTHTKGPWRIGDAGNTVFGPPCGLPPQRIADLSRTKNLHANGRLIAAAPELLEALKFYANPENWKEHETGIGMFPGDAMDYGYCARNAIAKATGKEDK